MTVLAGQAAVALENYLLNNRLSQVLSRDTLTGLLSFDTLWGIVSEHCASPQAAGYTMGLILLDIDRFKIFNRHYGREAGEMLLAQLATLLGSYLRKDDAASRYGGDEFALLLPWAGGMQLVDLAETLLKRIRVYSFLRGRVGRQKLLSVSVLLNIRGMPAIRPACSTRRSERWTRPKQAAETRLCPPRRRWWIKGL